MDEEQDRVIKEDFYKTFKEKTLEEWNEFVELYTLPEEFLNENIVWIKEHIDIWCVILSRNPLTFEFVKNNIDVNSEKEFNCVIINNSLSNEEKVSLCKIKCGKTEPDQELEAILSKSKKQINKNIVNPNKQLNKNILNEIIASIIYKGFGCLVFLCIIIFLLCKFPVVGFSILQVISIFMMIKYNLHLKKKKENQK